MDFNVLKEEKKPLLRRKDVEARIAYEQATPSRAAIRKEAAAKLQAKAELVIVTKVLPDMGSSSAEVEVRVYDDEKTMKAVEHEFTMKRHASKEEPKKEGEAAEAAPAEDKKE